MDLHHILLLGIGTLAFLMTAVHLVSCFPFFFHSIHEKGGSSTVALSFFMVGLAKYILWLLYLWPLEDAFVRIALGLEIVSSLVFILHAFGKPWKK